MKTDILFSEIFKEFPNVFFEFIGKPETRSDTYSFTSPEIKQKAFRLDGVFASTEEVPEEPIYFVEIQFYKDEEFYERFFTSIFLYFNQYKPVNNDWYAVVFYARRSQEIPIHERYNSLVEKHLKRFYLNEIEETENESIGRGIIRLIVETDKKTEELAKQLIERTKVEVSNEILQRQVVEFIETIIVYKFPLMSREQIENMLNLNLLRETKVYQEAKEEGKLEIVPKLLKKGLSIQEIAELLELDSEVVRKAAQS